MCHDSQHNIVVNGDKKEQNKKKISQIDKKVIEIHMFEFPQSEEENPAVPILLAGRCMYQSKRKKKKK
jgi:hypothetical protein